MGISSRGGAILRRRSTIVVAAALIAAAVVGSAVYKLAFSSGDLRSATPSATYRRGWIFHEKRELTLVPYPAVPDFPQTC